MRRRLIPCPGRSRARRRAAARGPSAARSRAAGSPPAAAAQARLDRRRAATPAWSATSRNAASGASPISSDSASADAVLGRQLAHDLPGPPERRRRRSRGGSSTPGRAPGGRAPAPRRGTRWPGRRGRPPPDSRTRRAIRFASSTSSESRLMFQAMRNGRAPTATAPDRGCIRDGPEVRPAPVAGRSPP